MDALHGQLIVKHPPTALPTATYSLLRRLPRLAVHALLIAASSVTPAFAGPTIVVPRDFSSVQDAIDAAPPGAIIKVRRGTYTEQIVIDKNVTLIGDDRDGTVIKAPSTLAPFAVNTFDNSPVAPIVRITDGASVKISGFTVSGPTPCYGVPGIAVVKNATLDLSRSRVTLIWPADPNCLGTAGFRSSGVIVGLPFFVLINGEQDGGTTGHATISGVTVDRYLSTGIAVLGPFQGPPSTAEISDNAITGGTSFAVSGQAGVTVSFASVARVIRNRISGTVCTDAVCGPDPFNEFQSAGIGINSSPAGTVIADNVVSDNDVGIYLFGGADCCHTRANKATDNRFFGIIIQDGDNTVSHNHISGGEVGIGVIASFVDTVGTSKHDKITRTSIAPVTELSCCGVTATAVVEGH
jgi:parallel beta-helix repeat protein